MNVCVIGAGYVGLTTAAVLSDIGNHVICVDLDMKKVESLRKGSIPIFEPNLQEIVLKNKQRLSFTNDLGTALENAEMVIVAVGTPPLPDGSSNLSYLYSAVFSMMKYATSHKIIMIKSTVPPGTNEAIYQSLIDQGYNSNQFTLVSNPEFLREGSAVYDMLHPDRIVVGLHEENPAIIQKVKELYHGIHAPFIITNYSGAELIKYASNAFLATKISFINEMARICEMFGADITHIAEGIGSDARIGYSFLQAGIGYGGSCFPKDLQSLSFVAKEKNITPHILDATQKVNDTQMDFYVNKIMDVFPDLSSLKIAMLGIAFKADTDDIRESRAIEFIKKLNQLGCTVHAYDPKAQLPNELTVDNQQHPNLQDTLKDADITIVATGWKEFLTMDWMQAKQLMRGNTIVDARNCLDKDLLESYGFQYIGVGRG
ncbi:UDP-glucose dehydrogenase family protein [Lederbergia graminis]|uniref:UDP-glucose 6-dehydrogenase n=1 Tax=Lederbergia graminis TaxID=735518 RepID=A0ABW0LJ46_9BACI